MIILGIETSCDETALALYDEARGLLGHVLHSQTEQLIKYGGVLPEAAARSHIQYLTPLLLELLTTHNLKLSDLNYIAYTKGPGLVGSLLTGIAFAKSLSFGLNIPAIGINHLEGHILACMLTKPPEVQPEFPFLALLVSGGHTMLINAKSLGDYAILGETLDDAAGEALDKTAKFLGINPPNGKELSDLAKCSTEPNRFTFPRPLIHQKNLNFSFSGLKTAAMLKIKELKTKELSLEDNLPKLIQADLAYAFQAAVMDSLIAKTAQALKITHLKNLVIAGGVSANHYLRTGLLDLNNKLDHNEQIKIFFPKLEFCTDNAAMIAVTAFLHLKQNNFYVDSNLDITAFARWDLANKAISALGNNAE